MANGTWISPPPIGLELRTDLNSTQVPVFPPVQQLHEGQGMWSWSPSCRNGNIVAILDIRFVTHLLVLWNESEHSPLCVMLLLYHWTLKKELDWGKKQFQPGGLGRKYYNLPTLTEAALFQLLGAKKAWVVNWIRNSVLFVKTQLTLEGEKKE